MAVERTVIAVEDAPRLFSVTGRAAEVWGCPTLRSGAQAARALFVARRVTVPTPASTTGRARGGSAEAAAIGYVMTPSRDAEWDDNRPDKEESGADDKPDDDGPGILDLMKAVARPLQRRRRVPTLAVVLVGIAVVFGVTWVLAELISSKTRTWTSSHPVAVTLGAGLILLVLTVFFVERWVALNESKRWRAPALAALQAYVSRMGSRPTDVSNAL